MENVRIALVGDYQASATAHRAIPRALELAADALQLSVSYKWLATASLEGDISDKLRGYSGIWVVPASPYESMQGALSAITYARETKTAFLGTCGGFQHAVLEFARNVLGLDGADNSEVNPGTTFPLIAPLVCALVEKAESISLVRNSKVAKLYGANSIAEEYRCSYGFNPVYVYLFSGTDLRVTGFDADDAPRVVELTTHPFFIGTAFQPERSALRAKTHPLVQAFVQSAATGTT